MLAGDSGGSSQAGGQIVKVAVGDATIFVEAQAPDGERTIAGFLDAPQSFSKVADGIAQMANSLLTAIKDAAPTGVEVEFGIDLKIEPEGLFALIVKGEASGSLKITLKWDRHD